jgi:hypothetical protein
MASLKSQVYPDVHTGKHCHYENKDDQWKDKKGKKEKSATFRSRISFCISIANVFVVAIRAMKLKYGKNQVGFQPDRSAKNKRSLFLVMHSECLLVVALCLLAVVLRLILASRGWPYSNSDEATTG